MFVWPAKLVMSNQEILTRLSLLLLSLRPSRTIRSYDGLNWHYTQESMTQVWSSEMSYTDGTNFTFHRREEPKIYAEKGQMLAMFNAVADSTGTYVMSQGIVSGSGSGGGGGGEDREGSGGGSNGGGSNEKRL